MLTISVQVMLFNVPSEEYGKKCSKKINTAVQSLLQ